MGYGQDHFGTFHLGPRHRPLVDTFKISQSKAVQLNALDAFDWIAAILKRPPSVVLFLLIERTGPSAAYPFLMPVTSV